MESRANNLHLHDNCLSPQPTNQLLIPHSLQWADGHRIECKELNTCVEYRTSWKIAVFYILIVFHLIHIQLYTECSKRWVPKCSGMLTMEQPGVECSSHQGFTVWLVHFLGLWARYALCAGHKTIKNTHIIYMPCTFGFNIKFLWLLFKQRVCLSNIGMFSAYFISDVLSTSLLSIAACTIHSVTCQFIQLET